MVSVPQSCRQEGADQKPPLTPVVPKNADEGVAKPPDANHTLPDSSLIANLVAGDEDAMAVLFQRYRRFAFRCALSILKDRGEAEDIVQRTFLEVCQSARRFDPLKGSFATWLFSIVSHTALNRKDYLRVRRFYSTLPLEEADSMAVVQTNGLFHLTPQELAQLTREFLETVKPAERQALELKFFEGLTADQISLKTGKSASACENHLYRALKKLKSLIAKSRLQTG